MVFFFGTGSVNVDNIDIGNSGTWWRLSNFLVFNQVGGGFNVPDMNGSNLLVNFAELANGFSVSYSTQGGFAFTAPQSNAWSNGMWITALSAPSSANNITGVTASYSGGTGDLNFSLRKSIQNQSGANLIPSPIVASYATVSPTNNVTASGNFGSSLSINDRAVFDAAGTGGGSIGSYTNTFTTSSDIPEPMSFLLMGVGLVGIAALRRRSL